MGVAVAVGTGVKVGGMGEGVVVGVDVGGAITAVQDVSITRIMQIVKRKTVGRSCRRIGAILPSDFEKFCTRILRHSLWSQDRLKDYTEKRG